MNFIASIFARLAAAFPVNRVVSILTPLVFMPVAAAVTGWLGEHFPGVPNIDADHLVALQVIAATGALAVAYKWLSGWQKYEARAHTDTADLDTNEPGPDEQGEV